MRIHSRREPGGPDTPEGDPPAAQTDGDAMAQHQAGQFARTLVGILIVLLVAAAVVVIAML